MGVSLSGPIPIVLPPDFPSDFPPSIALKARVILGDLVKQLRQESAELQKRSTETLRRTELIVNQSTVLQPKIDGRVQRLMQQGSRARANTVNAV